MGVNNITWDVTWLFKFFYCHWLCMLLSFFIVFIPRFIFIHLFDEFVINLVWNRYNGNHISISHKVQFIQSNSSLLILWHLEYAIHVPFLNLVQLYIGKCCIPLSMKLRNSSIMTYVCNKVLDFEIGICNRRIDFYKSK